jgi:cell shape-determining protein MreD
MMLRYTLSLLLIYLVMLFAQPMVPVLFNQNNWLLGLTPVLLTYLSLRAGDLALITFVIVGGLLHDLVLLHYVGMGPLLWGIVAFMIRSQRIWLEDARWPVWMVMSFAATFLYLCCDRLFFLFAHQYWSWDQDLNFNILKLSLFNAILCPLLFWLLDFIFGKRKQQRHRRAH